MDSKDAGRLGWTNITSHHWVVEKESGKTQESRQIYGQSTQGDPMPCWRVWNLLSTNQLLLTSIILVLNKDLCGYGKRNINTL